MKNTECISVQVSARHIINTAISVAVFMLLSLALVPRALADDLPAPDGDVILSIDGNITNTNAAGQAQFDITMLESLGTTLIKSETPWTDGVQTFEGVSAKLLLEYIGASGTTVSATAINDYVVELPLSDMRDLGVIIATKLNGQHMRVRDKGPLWVIYPWGDNPSLQNELYYARSIWQLKEITIK